MKRIVVFCASGIGKKEIYKNTAYELGKVLAEKDIGVVYGGAKLGLMGALAQGALDAGGEVIGVLPDFMSKREIAHPDLTRLIMVKSMHERKLKMHELSNGIIALPGGFGTFEELFEMLTWAQLGLHQNPIGILNVEGYYDALIAMFDHMVNEGLLKTDHYKMVHIDGDIEGLLNRMFTAKPSSEENLLNESRT